MTDALLHDVPVARPLLERVARRQHLLHGDWDIKTCHELDCIAMCRVLDWPSQPYPTDDWLGLPESELRLLDGNR